MANKGNVIVTGDKALDKTMATMEAKIQKKVARHAMRVATRGVILPQALRRVPVGKASKGSRNPGALKKSLTVKAFKRSRSRTGVAVVAGDGFFQGETYYSGMVEFGTKNMQANPFLRAAGYESKPQVQALIVADIRKALAELGK